MGLPGLSASMKIISNGPSPWCARPGNILRARPTKAARFKRPGEPNSGRACRFRGCDGRLSVVPADMATSPYGQDIMRREARRGMGGKRRLQAGRSRNQTRHDIIVDLNPAPIGHAAKLLLPSESIAGPAATSAPLNARFCRAAQPRRLRRNRRDRRRPAQPIRPMPG